MQQNFEKQVVSNVSQENVSKTGLSGLALHPASLPLSAVHQFSHMSHARVVAPAWPLRVLLCMPLSPLPCLVSLLSLSSFHKSCTFSDVGLSLPISLCSHTNPWPCPLPASILQLWRNLPTMWLLWHQWRKTLSSSHAQTVPLNVHSPYLELGHSCLELPRSPGYLISCPRAPSARGIGKGCCDPMDCSLPGFPVLHSLPEFAQTHVHWISDAIQPSHRQSLPSPPALNLAQHHSLWIQETGRIAVF